MKKILLFFMLILFAVVVNAGYWVELSTSYPSACSALTHVMCAEYSDDTAIYNSISGAIPYNSSDVSSSSNLFCAILDSTDNFGFLNDSRVTNFTSLVSYRDSLLAEESCNVRDYGTGYALHYDENCNAIELFPNRLSSGMLDLSQYNENNKTYNVSSNISNVDFFDILSGCGSFIQGNVTDASTGLSVANATVNIHFKNPYGLSEPYMNFTTNNTGNFSTLEVLKSISTAYGNYTNVTRKIPLTDYVVVVKHPFYADYVTEVSLSTLESGGAFLGIALTPISICEPDCTFTTGTVCRAICDGINGCSFDSSVPGLNMSSVLDGVPQGTLFNFNYNSLNYTVQACLGTPSLNDGSVDAKNSAVCPDGTNAWKTTRLVRLNGQLVRMIVTLCE